MITQLQDTDWLVALNNWDSDALDGVRYHSAPPL